MAPVAAAAADAVDIIATAAGWGQGSAIHSMCSSVALTGEVPVDQLVLCWPCSGEQCTRCGAGGHQVAQTTQRPATERIHVGIAGQPLLQVDG